MLKAANTRAEIVAILRISRLDYNSCRTVGLSNLRRLQSRLLVRRDTQLRHRWEFCGSANRLFLPILVDLFENSWREASFVFYFASELSEINNLIRKFDTNYFILAHSIVTTSRMNPYTNRDFLACRSDFITKLTVQVIHDCHSSVKLSVHLFPAKQMFLLLYNASMFISFGSKAKLTVTCGELYLNINHNCSHFGQPWQHTRMRHQNPFSPNWRTTQLLRRPTKRTQTRREKNNPQHPTPDPIPTSVTEVPTRQVGWRFWFSITDLWLFIHYNCGNKQMEGALFRGEGGASLQPHQPEIKKKETTNA